MNDELEKVSTNNEDSQRLPSLSLIELMIITSVMAFTVAFQDKLVKGEISFPTNVLWFNVIQRTLMVLTIGIPFAAIWRFILQKKTVGKFFLHPGHWYLFVALVINVGFLCPILLQWYFVAKYKATLVAGFDISQLIRIGSLIASLIAFGISLVAVTKLSRWWKVVFVLFSISLLVRGAQSIAHYLMFSSGNFTAVSWLSGIYWSLKLMNLAIFVVATIALATDIRSGRYRELWHWVGVFLMFLAHAVMPLVEFVFVRFFSDPRSLP